ncbi:MAG: polysaccharide biosynthesis tyrosine autokinase [Actinomycetota bacterium]
MGERINRPVGLTTLWILFEVDCRVARDASNGYRICQPSTAHSMREATQPSGEDTSPSLRTYLAILRVRRRWVIGATVLGVAASLLYSFLQTPMYEAQAKVLVRPVTLSPAELTAPVPPNLETERGLAASVTVADRVVDELQLSESPHDLVASLQVDVVTGSDFLSIRYEHTDPVEAQRLAQAFAEAYLDFRRDQAIDSVLAASGTIEQRIQKLNGKVIRLNRRLLDLRGRSDGTTLEARKNTAIGQIAVLEQQLSELVVPENLQVGQVIEPASVSASPTSPDYPRNVALALFAGLATGIALAFIRERLDDRLRNREDFESHAGTPVLAVVPKVGGWKRRKEARLITVDEPRSAASEAYRTLRTSFTFAASRTEIRSVLITSPQVEEGKTTTAANLGVVLAQTGKRVILVDADVRRPRLHKFFPAENEKGLTDVLAEEADASDVLAESGITNLRLLPCGPLPGTPTELLSSNRMGEVLEELRQSSDFVIVDTAPVLAAADATILATFADGILLVADAARATRGSVSHARDQLDQVNANVLGAVLNNFDLSKARAYPYYQYYYAYRYEAEEPKSSRLRAASDPADLESRIRSS